MEPETSERLLLAVAFALSDLVLVVREDKVLAATVNINTLFKVSHRHCAALDVPARPACSPRAVPGGLSGLLGFPESEVPGVFLRFVHLDASAGQQIFRAATAEFAVVVIASYTEIYIAVNIVRIALRFQRFNHVNDCGDFGSSPRVSVRGQDI